jgi:hypothetical protein
LLPKDAAELPDAPPFGTAEIDPGNSIHQNAELLPAVGTGPDQQLGNHGAAGDDFTLEQELLQPSRLTVAAIAQIPNPR